MFEDSRTKVFVCDITNGNAASYAALPDRSGGFFLDPVTTATHEFEEHAVGATNPVRFVYRNTKGILSMTVPFVSSEIKNGGYVAGVAQVEQVSYLGYNGTSGSLDCANSTYYGLKVILNHTFGTLNNSPLILTIPYKSDASATQSEVAAGLANAATSLLKRQAYKPFKVERINSGAQLNAMASATALLTNGSKQVTLSEDESLTCFAGSIIRFGTSGAGTAPCYIVASIAANGLDVVLDQEYQGATAATYAHGTIETVTEGNWGLKFTGVSVTDANFDPINDEPFVSSFTLQAPGFTTATVTNTTAPVLGSGTYQLVSALEARSQFENKDRTISAYPRTVYNIDATTGTAGEGKYNMFAFEVWKQATASPTTGVAPISKVRYVIAVEHGLTEAFHTVLGFGS